MKEIRGLQGRGGFLSIEEQTKLVDFHYGFETDYCKLLRTFNYYPFPQESIEGRLGAYLSIPKPHFGERVLPFTDAEKDYARIFAAWLCMLGELSLQNPEKTPFEVLSKEELSGYFFLKKEIQRRRKEKVVEAFPTVWVRKGILRKKRLVFGEQRWNEFSGKLMHIERDIADIVNQRYAWAAYHIKLGEVLHANDMLLI